MTAYKAPGADPAMVYMVEAMETTWQDRILEVYREEADAKKREKGLRSNGRQFVRWWPERLR